MMKNKKCSLFNYNITSWDSWDHKHILNEKYVISNNLNDNVSLIMHAILSAIDHIEISIDTNQSIKGELNKLYFY